MQIVALIILCFVFKARFLKRIKELTGITSAKALSKKVGLSDRHVGSLLELVEPGSEHLSLLVE